MGSMEKNYKQDTTKQDGENTATKEGNEQVNDIYVEVLPFCMASIINIEYLVNHEW